MAWRCVPVVWPYATLSPKRVGELGWDCRVSPFVPVQCCAGAASSLSEFWGYGNDYVSLHHLPTSRAGMNCSRHSQPRTLVNSLLNWINPASGDFRESTRSRNQKWRKPPARFFRPSCGASMPRSSASRNVRMAAVVAVSSPSGGSACRPTRPYPFVWRASRSSKQKKRPVMTVAEGVRAAAETVWSRT